MSRMPVFVHAFLVSFSLSFFCADCAGVFAVLSLFPVVSVVFWPLVSFPISFPLLKSCRSNIYTSAVWENEQRFLYNLIKEIILRMNSGLFRGQCAFPTIQMLHFVVSFLCKSKVKVLYHYWCDITGKANKIKE